MLPKCCAEHQKPDAFQRFSPTFQKLFLKRDLFESFNGGRYPLGVGGWTPCRNGIPPKARIKLKKRGAYPKSGSIMKEDMADRCRVGPRETVVQHDRHVHQSVSPNS